jgi:hypothetical protein
MEPRVGTAVGPRAGVGVCVLEVEGGEAGEQWSFKDRAGSGRWGRRTLVGNTMQLRGANGKMRTRCDGQGRTAGMFGRSRGFLRTCFLVGSVLGGPVSVGQ